MHRLGTTRARWNLLAQQTLMHRQTRIDPQHPERGPLIRPDTWSGYPAARDRVFRRWAEAGTRGPIALGGDIHAFAAADCVDPDAPGGPPVGAEFVGGSITSVVHDAAYKRQAAADGIAFAENEVRGYGRLDLTAAGGTCVFRGVDDALREDSGVHDLARFRLDPQRPGIHLENA